MCNWKQDYLFGLQNFGLDLIMAQFIFNLTLIRMGQIIALAGAALLFLPLPSTFSLIGFIIIGLGLAPIFPCVLNETPTRLGKKHSKTSMAIKWLLTVHVVHLCGQFLVSLHPVQQ